MNKICFPVLNSVDYSTVGQSYALPHGDTTGCRHHIRKSMAVWPAIRAGIGGTVVCMAFILAMLSGSWAAFNRENMEYGDAIKSAFNVRELVNPDAWGRGAGTPPRAGYTLGTILMLTGAISFVSRRTSNAIDVARQTVLEMDALKEYPHHNIMAELNKIRNTVAIVKNNPSGTRKYKMARASRATIKKMAARDGAYFELMLRGLPANANRAFAKDVIGAHLRQTPHDINRVVRTFALDTIPMAMITRYEKYITR